MTASMWKRGGAVLAFVSLENELGDIASGIEEEVDEVLREETEKMAESARQTLSGFSMPYSTGDLYDSIKVVEDDRPGYSGYRVIADARSTSGRYDVPYAHMVEYGSVHNQPARPFLTPALEERRQETLDAVNDKLEELADQ